jgi:hypothetical protein
MMEMSCDHDAENITSTYRVINRGGDYIDTDQLPAMSADIWAIIDLDIAGGGDAYQQLLRTLSVAAP